MTDTEIQQAHTRTVDALQRAYAILIGLALTSAVRILLDANGVVVTQSAPGERVSTNVIFVAFLSTLVVFYHGMNRHLDDTFVIGGIPNRSRLLLLTDIFVFLAEGAVLVAMGSTISNPIIFLKAWTFLLVVDVLWGLFVYTIAGKPPFKWVANNCVFLVVAWVSWLWVFPGNPFGIAAAETLRSIIDYTINWKFYFPAPASGEQPVV